MNATLGTEQWPGWARALVIGQFALIVAVLIPWIVMSLTCAWAWAACGWAEFSR